jgi:hypothetical protein
MIYKKYRVREELYQVVKYIEWKLLLNGRHRTEIKYIMDEIINEALNEIMKNKFKIITSKYNKERDLIGFTLQKETIDRLYKEHERLNLMIGELIEICVFYYFKKHFSEEEFVLNKLQNWEIHIAP